MGAVVTCGVVGIVVVIIVVPVECLLCTVIELAGIVTAVEKVAVLAYDVLKISNIDLGICGHYGECFVGVADTGINDGYEGTFAGVAKIPSLLSADSYGAVGHVGSYYVFIIIIGCNFESCGDEGGDAVELIELFKHPVLALEGETVEKKSELVFDLDLLAKLGFNALDLSGELCEHFFSNLCRIAYGLGLLKGGCAIYFYKYHDIRVGVDACIAFDCAGNEISGIIRLDFGDGKY